MKKMRYLSPVLISLLLSACNSGTNSASQTQPNPPQDGSLEYFTKTLSSINGGSKSSQGYPTANYQHSFRVPEKLGIYAINYEYFSDESCTQKVYASVMSSTGKAVDYSPNTYTTTSVTGIYICNQFNYMGNIGCYGEWTSTNGMQQIKSTRFSYVFDKVGQNLVTYGGCKYNPDIGTEAPADYTYEYGPSQFCMESGNCGYSQQYAPDIIQTATSWVLGSKTANAAGVYGTKGVASRTNIPGARALGATFYDESGNIYLYGGVGVDSTGATGRLNDMWKYTSKENTWTWVDGQNVVINSIDTGLLPGALSEMQYWTVPNSDSNDFYVFGGFGYSNAYNLHDDGAFWKYNTKTKSWKLLQRSSNAESTDKPGARRGGSMARINNKLYMFGGYGFTTSLSEGVTNELWEYDTSTQKWTRLGGSYDLKPAATATWPSGRYRAAMWRSNDGMIYMFGGTGVTFSGSTSGTFGYTLNDFWQYNPQTNNWTLLNDGITTGPFGNYGTRLYGSIDNYPAYRAGAITWTDAQGNLWLYGGVHMGADGSGVTYFNDLWKYQPTTKKWTWVAGDKIDGSTLNQARYGNYGTRNLATNSTVPGGRYGAMSMTDGYNLWIIGGNGYDETSVGYLNGIWKITPVATY